MLPTSDRESGLDMVVLGSISAMQEHTTTL